MKNAFTLAEVLVTLGIIGVVSAMTVPALLQNHQRKSYVTQIHKVYNELQQAALQYMTDKNAVNLVEAGLTNDINAVDAFMKTYFKIVQECDSMDDCFADEYKSLQGSVDSSYSRDIRSFVLANGASIRPSYAPEGSYKLLNIGVDINGKKGPNILGRDFFFFAVYKNGLIDDYSGDVNDNAPLTEEARDNMFNTQCNAGAPGSSWGCFGKILNDNWEMTY